MTAVGAWEGGWDGGPRGGGEVGVRSVGVGRYGAEDSKEPIPW